MITKDDIIYVSGPMTGYENYNHNSFVEASHWLQETFGCMVHCPARSFMGRKDLPLKVYMRHDIHMILESTALVFLPGWENSKGAKEELTVGVAMLELPYYIYEDLKQNEN